jgi:hypothetical protein
MMRSNYGCHAGQTNFVVWIVIGNGAAAVDAAGLNAPPLVHVMMIDHQTIVGVDLVGS